MNPSGQPSVELALSELRRSMDVGLTEIRGQLAILLLRSEQSEKRADEQAKSLESLEDRMGKVERDGVTNDDLERKSTRTIQIVGVIVALIGIMSGAGTSVLIAFLT